MTDARSDAQSHLPPVRADNLDQVARAVVLGVSLFGMSNVSIGLVEYVLNEARKLGPAADVPAPTNEAPANVQ